jgi:hypothetical protein
MFERAFIASSTHSLSWRDRYLTTARLRSLLLNSRGSVLRVHTMPFSNETVSIGPNHLVTSIGGGLLRIDSVPMSPTTGPIFVELPSLAARCSVLPCADDSVVFLPVVRCYLLLLLLLLSAAPLARQNLSNSLLPEIVPTKHL